MTGGVEFAIVGVGGGFVLAEKFKGLMGYCGD
jgi:hypothetical protein